jgi:pimeloyl-ACP methyl ester carboxylesterase
MHVEESHAVAADGTRLFWRSAGRDAPALILCDGIGCAGYIWRYLFPQLAAHNRMIHWNLRGHGKSERPRDLDRTSLLDCVEDLFAVMDAAGEREAVLVGHSMGVQVCLEAHRRHPSRVQALVLACGAPGRTLDTFHDGPLLAAVFPYIKRLVLARPAAARWVFRTLCTSEIVLQLARYLEVNRYLVAREDLERYFADLAEVDPEVFVKTLSTAARHDASDHLPHIAVPTLVIAGEKDSFTPLALSLRMHAAIPGSEMLVVPGGTHVTPIEHRDLVALRLEKFLDERVAGARRRRAGALRPGRPSEVPSV